MTKVKQEMRVITALATWNYKATGRCYVCERDALDGLAHVTGYAAPPKMDGPLPKPGSREESDAVDFWMRGASRKQRTGDFSPLSQYDACGTCLARMGNGFNNNQMGTFLYVAGVTMRRPLFIAFLAYAKPGYGQPLGTALITGWGKPPELAELLAAPDNPDTNRISVLDI